MITQENLIVDNIARKIEVALSKRKITILALSKLLDIDKQPLYRIIKREHIPNINLLESISTFLKCTINELIDKNHFLDVTVTTIDKLFNTSYKDNYRVYFYDESFVDKIDYKFFGILKETNISVYYETSKIITDGIYLINGKNDKLETLNIISVGKNLIIALVDNNERRFNSNSINVCAKLYKTVAVVNSEGCAMKTGNINCK